MTDSGKMGGSMSGLSANEAKEFNRMFMMSFIIFTVIAIVAHFLVWQWRPWFPGIEGYVSSLTDSAGSLANIVLTRFT